jgi:hypothetical protein
MPQKSRQFHEAITIGNVEKKIFNLRARDNDQEVIPETGGFVDAKFHSDFFYSAKNPVSAKASLTWRQADNSPI